ncbi:hypothetical protein GGQ13_001855 [Salinibacter ruber]|nr:hypothetical protein [Salinibacter ruber]
MHELMKRLRGTFGLSIYANDTVSLFLESYCKP